MNRDFGELSDLVKAVGLLVSAVLTIALAWRGRTRWEPSDQDLPRAPLDRDAAFARRWRRQRGGRSVDEA